MIIIYNSIIPFKKFKILNFFGIFFVRSRYKDLISIYDINHENIHTAQMKELFYFLFYILYFIEWLYYLAKKHNFYKAYRSISFEQEAFTNESNLKYLQNRKHFNQYRKLC